VGVVTRDEEPAMIARLGAFALLFVTVFIVFAAPDLDLVVRLAIFVVGLVVTVVFLTLRNRRVNADALQGIALLNQGRFSDALAAFQRGLAKYSRSNALVFNTGLCFLALWRVSEADAAFAKAAGMTLARLTFDVTTMLVPQRALVAALLGRTDEARAHVATCQQLGLSRSAQVFLTTAVLAVRAGDFAEGRRALSVYEIRLLGGPTRGLADALSAWCLEQTTGERRHVDRLGLFGEAGPDAIRRFWPELADFLERAPAA
jgi:tetratricopeptide (TPR) repeat protein